MIKMIVTLDIVYRQVVVAVIVFDNAFGNWIFVSSGNKDGRILLVWIS